MRWAVLVALLATTARADVPLVLDHAPPHLRMRPRAAAKPAPRPAPAKSSLPTPPAPLSQTDPSDRGDELAGLRDVREPVSFSLTVGYQVDGARPSGKASLDAPVQEGRDYNALRSYGFGELFLSTRGVVMDSLASYVALRFDALQAPKHVPAGDGEFAVAPPIATWFERNTFEVRTGWAELKDFLPSRLGLKKLRLRAGSQYVYGPWVMHLDGAVLAYDGDVVAASAYAGGRHSDYDTDFTDERYAVTGASLRINLRDLARLPITIGGQTMSLTSYVPGQPDSTHRQLDLDWQPRRDFTVRGQLRTLDDKLANERLQVRARYGQVTNFAFELTRRFDTDWRWDPSLVVNDDPTAARRYLDFGPVLPQIVASLRGGTLLAENVDLLIRTTIAADQTTDQAKKTSYAASYFEIGGAIDVRLRRELSLGINGLNRRTSREDIAPIIDTQLAADPLPPSTALGETSFTELGTRVRLSLGARRFSAQLEVYGRSTNYAAVYRDPTNAIPHHDTRGGGRVSVDAWVNRRLRLAVAYDATSTLALQPEITLYKSLRLTMTGLY